jgi:hypothetical protein
LHGACSAKLNYYYYFWFFRFFRKRKVLRQKAKKKSSNLKKCLKHKIKKINRFKNRIHEILHFNFDKL